MKNNDLLIYSGIGLAAYFLFLKPKTVVPAPATFVPTGATQTYLPPVPATNPITSSLSNIATTISNLIKPPVSAIAPVPVTAATNTFDQQIADTVLATPPLPTQTLLQSTLISDMPVYKPVLLNTPSYVDGFNNNTIYTTKGTLISGVQAARIGIY